MTGMKQILMPVLLFVIVPLFLLTACKEENTAENFDDHPATVQEMALTPLVSEKYVPPQKTPKDSAKLEGYVDTERYSLEGINKYQRGDSMLGTWSGVEGTSLQIERDDREYKITVTNLDGPRDFAAKATDKGIEFKRDGKKELITMGDGVDTGMKYLQDKIDCVVINAGSEGFCRD